jgi:hypothetical protein
MRVSAVVVSVLGSALLAAACGGDDGGGDAGGASSDVLVELLANVPLDDELPRAFALDVEAAREALGIEPGAPLDPTTDDLDVQRLARAAGLVLAAPFARFGLEDLDAVLDLEAISAMVGDDIGSAVVVRTSQSWDDLAERLEVDGFTRSGDRWSTDGGSSFPYAAVGRLGDDVVLSISREHVDAVLDGGRAPEAAVAAISGVDGALRGLVLLDGCVESVAMGDDMGERDAAGSIVATVAGEADPDRVLLDLGDLADGEPTVAGSTVTAPFRYRPASVPGPLPLASVEAFQLALSFQEIYDCR